MNIDPGTSNRHRDSDILESIALVLDERVRPELGPEGIEIELVGMDVDRIVQVRLAGACQGCSSSMAALITMVDAIVRTEVPEIRFVEAVP